MYRLTHDPECVVRIEDSMYIPRGHRWWDEYEAWLAAGNEAEPADPPATLQSLKDGLRAAATAQRWSHETGGIEVGGVSVATGLEDQNRISSVLAAGQLGDLAEVDFKAASGWTRLTLAEIQAIAGAISVHVQACFSAERAHHEAIDALPDIAAAEAYDVTSGWPA
ncbi:DUF4376 domain-containing protein [Stenotrophomonas sp. HITSZ_GD]|uniref:DUF4376 domain-containing protein n=1 Tax=Stenotrophomonas sp. HITSZ_GD TaxID=3037248 RepID=UPI00240DC9C8|nr:DUF4376 domain-containing protein [Stenotrophomonas sp. HITSZ_GD]MDG2524654.1 DUF4376 domain-containing protein [Stenotrophomonas sp. HITSZ_GD]